MTPFVLRHSMKPYYQDAHITLYHARFEDLHTDLPAVDAVITDPPYEETALHWDKWPAGWPGWCRALTRQLWCFGTLKLFMRYAHEFSGWTIAQDLIWEKHNGTGLRADRFKRVHEQILHAYTGDWDSLHKQPQVTHDAVKRTLKRQDKPAHWKAGASRGGYRSEEGGPRLMRSVQHHRSCHGHAVHPTQKPIGILEPILAYTVPPGGLILDPFAGSAATLVTAKQMGRRAIGIELLESHCEAAATRLQQTLPLGA